MRRSSIAVLVTIVVAGLFAALSSASGSPAAPQRRDPLDAYTATVSPEELSDLAAQGFDVGETQQAAGSKVEGRPGPGQQAGLAAPGLGREARPDPGQGRQDAAPVRRRPGGRRLHRVALVRRARRHPRPDVRDRQGQPADRQAGQGRHHASRVARSWPSSSPRAPSGQKDGSRPAVLYSGTQHAREWIATEVTRRLMNDYVAKWRANDRSVRKLLQTTELWFMPVLNPDGYQYTFDTERLWRKNLRDNNGDGQISVGDGVDPNRNFPSHWGYDNEGSSPITSSETYRGPSAASEPETKAMVGLFGRIGFALHGQLPLQRPVAALQRRLADRHPDRGRPDLLRALRQPRQAGDRGLPPGPQLGRPLRHQRRDRRLRAGGRRHPVLDAGALPRLSTAADSSSPTTRRWCRRSSSATCRSRGRSPTRRSPRTTRRP